MHTTLNSRDKALALVEKIENLDTRNWAKASLTGSACFATMVRAFHLVYGLPIVTPAQAAEDFSHISKKRLAMRFGLIDEEFVELCEAMDIRATIKYEYLNADEEWVVATDVVDAIEQTDERKIGQIADACFDLKYVITGFEYEIGIEPQVTANEGQASNLSKLGLDGKPIYRADGKVLKGPNFFEPDMLKALRSYGLRSSIRM